MEKYSSGLVAESFWFTELKQIIKLRYNNVSWDEIKKLCVEENLLGIAKQSRSIRIYGYLKGRVDCIDKELMEIFLSSDLETQKLINIISVARKNKLFLEFLYEIYREKAIIGHSELTPSDINIFFKDKQLQDSNIATWTDVTFRRLRSTYMNFLTDAGMVRLHNKKRLITLPILDIVLENYLVAHNEMTLLKALTGGR